MNQGQGLLDIFDDLEADHRVIDQVLDALEAASPEAVDLEFFRQVVVFIRQFADGHHHEKEEEHLFPALEKAGMMRTMGPLGVMLEEHEQARVHVARMDELLESEDLAVLCEEGRAYATLMRQHIQKEDQALFMMGRSMLPMAVRAQVSMQAASVGDAQTLRDSFRGVAQALLGRTQT